MKKSGSIGLVVALIIFAVLLFVVIGQSGKKEKEGVKELKVEKIEKDAVTKFEITVPPAKSAAGGADAGPEKAAEAPKKVVLEKDGAGWKVYDPAAADKKFVADDAQVKTALDAAGEFATGDLISDKKEKLADLEIDEGKGTTVAVYTGANKKALDLVFGRPAKGGGSTVRTAGSSDVFVAKGRLGSVVKKDLSAWRKKALFDLKPDDVTKVSTKLADGSVVTVESSAPPPPPPAATPDAGPPPTGPKAEWKLTEPAALPAGFRLDSAQLSRAASAVATLRAQDFADGASDDVAGFTGPHTVVEATTKDGKKVVHLGKEDDKKRVYAKVDGDPQVYLLASYTAKQLQRSLDDMRDLTLLTAKIDDVEKVTFKGASGTVVVKKDGDAWKLVEPKKAPDGFDESQIGTQVASALRTRATRVAADAPKTAVDAKSSPWIEFALKGGKKQTVRFGEAVPADENDAAKNEKKDKRAEAHEYYVKGGADDLTYVVATFTRNRFDKPLDLFKKPPAPPPGMGGPGGSIPGMENLPPDVRKKLEESLKKGDFPGGGGHP